MKTESNGAIETRAAYGRSAPYLTLIVLALSVGVCARGQASSIEDNHIFHLGAYEQDLDVSGSAGRDGMPGIEIDFDRVLGVDQSSTTPFFSYQWRFAEKWSLQVYYSQLEASGKRQAERDFTWDGKEYSVGSVVGTDFELDTLLLGANYSFVRNEDLELGLGIGLHAFDIGTTLSATAHLGDNNGEVRRSTSDVLAPLPNVRMYGTYLITSRWEVNASLGWLSLSYEDYEGDYLYINALTQYRVTERFGIGLSYQSSALDFSKESRRRSASFDIDISGPSLFVTYGF